ncbi:thermonuclease family protein [Flexibacterium corallicola]|uniref:thermonuclease family protein n=1 Tax=Flexibacterium corallicola TaxID=3037259 RepID=UPI00286FAB09|nr:thermonuclease family protein [Pseudovibrio sp. M1P-2-3]
MRWIKKITNSLVPVLLCFIAIGALAFLAFQREENPSRPVTSALTLYKPSSLPQRTNIAPKEASKPDSSVAVSNTDDQQQVTGKGASPAQGDAKKQEPADLLAIHRPLILDGASFQHNGRKIRLAHLSPLPLDRTCSSWLGGAWPCGMRARTALRAFLLQVSVECSNIQETGEGYAVATCKRGEVDVAHWLLENGWASPTTDAPAEFNRLAKEAKQKKRGIWQTERKKMPSNDFLVPAGTQTGPREVEEEEILIQTQPQIYWKQHSPLQKVINPDP